MPRRLFNKLYLLIAVVIGSVGLWALPVSSQSARDCDDNAVIRCGALTVEELKRRCRENAGNTQAIFREFRINNCGSALDGLVMGRVTKDGQVFIGDRLVATNAMSSGRQRMSSSDTPIAGGIAYKRPPSVSFRSESLQAFVKMDAQNKMFQYAVLLSCGNPISAFSVPPPAQPAATCQSLTFANPNRKPTERTVKFIAKATVSDGATVQAFNFDFDNNGTVDRRIATNSLTQEVTHTYPGAGSFTARVTVDTSLGPKTGGACAIPVSVQEEKTPNFETVKDVRVKGQSAWQQHVTAKPGDHLEYRITVRNTGQTDFAKVTVRDDIPNHVSVVENSLKVNGQTRQGNIESGVDIGQLKAGQHAEITLEVAISTTAVNAGECKMLPNVAFARPDNLPEEQDDASAEVCIDRPPQVQAAVTTTTTLPKAGIGNVAAIFVGTTALGTFYYRLRSFYARFLNQ